MSTWTQSEQDGRLVLCDGRVVATCFFVEAAEDIVKTMNGQAPNTRAHVVRALQREANRIYQTQEKEYPSNVLDVVAANLSDGCSTMLTVKDGGGK